MRITPSQITPVNALETGEQLCGSTQVRQEEGEQVAARNFSDHADAPDSLRIIENDARMKTALIDEARRQRTKRFVSGVDPLIVGPLLARAIAAVVASVRNKDEAAAPAKTDRFVFLTIDKESPAWGTLSAIQTATQALLAAAVTQHGELGFAVAEGFIERLLDPSGERARSLPLEVSRVVDNETKRQRLSELAALLYCAARVKISPSTREITVEGGIALNQFNPALEGEALRRRMFERPSLPEHELQDKIYFDGNTLVNAVGKSVSELAEEPSLLNIPAYARLSASDRLEAVERFLDERGLDYQYPIGGMENAMASVLKAAALARGNPAPEPYATEADVFRAFIALVNDWQQVDGTLIDPRVLLGINLAKTRGIALAGNTPEERFADLCSYLNDVLIEYSGPPHFDERAVTLEILMEETGLSAAQLIQPLKTTGKRMLDTFLDRSKQTPISDAALIADNGAEIHVPSVARKLKKAESTFRTDGRFDAPYFSAAARLRLRTVDKVPQTEAAIEAILAELVKTAQKEESDARTAEAVREIAKQHPPRIIDPFVGPIVNSVNWILARVKEHDSERGTNIRHWLDNMPILSNVIGFAEGVETANLEQIINSLPVVGTAYNMGDGLRTGDHERFGMAVVSMVPLVGPGVTIAEGIANDDTAQVVGGILGLALDAAPFAEGKGKAGGVRKVISYSALDDARMASRSIPFEGISRPLQVQVNQSLTALRDLGFAPDAKALKIARVKVPGKAAPKPVPSISTIRSLDVVRVAKKLEGYEVATRPAMLQRTASGMLWDPATAAHYAELEGNLYRLAPDRAKTTPERPIWNVVSPDGSNRVMTVRLEYIFGPEMHKAGWVVARDLPGLNGGGRTTVTATGTVGGREFTDSSAKARIDAMMDAKAEVIKQETAENMAKGMNERKATASARGKIKKAIEDEAKGKRTLISDFIAEKTATRGADDKGPVPNGDMFTAHAEIAVIQKAYEAGVTVGAELRMTVRGKDVCGSCKEHIPEAAKAAGLSAIIVEATDDLDGKPKTYYWEQGMDKLEVRQ